MPNNTALDYTSFDAEYDDVPEVQVIRTGILGVDILLGGGLLAGRVTEVVGKEGTGKSTIAYCAAATTQAAGGRVAWIEAANQQFAVHYAEACGISMRDLVLVTPSDTIESILRLTEDLVSSGVFSLVVLDDIQRGFRDGTRTKWAQLSKQELRPLAQATTQTGTTLLMTTNLTWSWIHSHPFWISQQLQTIGKSKTTMDVGVLRSPIGMPGRIVTVPLIAEQGVDHLKHLLQLATDLGYIEERHGHYTYEGEKLGHGAATAASALGLKSDSTIAQITKQIKSATLSREIGRAMVAAR